MKCKVEGFQIWSSSGRGYKSKYYTWNCSRIVGLRYRETKHEGTIKNYCFESIWRKFEFGRHLLEFVTWIWSNTTEFFVNADLWTNCSFMINSLIPNGIQLQLFAVWKSVIFKSPVYLHRHKTYDRPPTHTPQ